GDDPYPWMAAGRDRRKGADVVLDDRIGLNLVEDLDEPLVDVLRPVDQGLPRWGHELLELLEGRLAEDRGRLADEVLPELAGLLGDLRGRRQPHQPLLESLLLQGACEGLLDHEDHAVAALPQHLADADAVVRRPERPLGEEDDRPGVRVSHRHRGPYAQARLFDLILRP